MRTEHIDALATIVGAENLTLDHQQRVSGSKDCYHFSPVLIPQLDGRAADVIARPQNQEQLRQLISWAAEHRVPVTPRGAGTGNYGQGVPLNGGLMINTKDLNQIVSLTKDEARAEAGVILQEIERQAATVGAELRCFPSTVPTSSTGGFITGGSGGIGSIEWGMLRETDNVRHARILTVEEEPRVLDLPREDLDGVLHNCGLTCFVAEVTLALAPKRQWYQYVIAFDDFYRALAGAQELAENTSFKKRLVTAFEWPVPTFFVPLHKRGAFPEGCSVVFLYADQPPSTIEPIAARLGGKVSFMEEPRSDAKRGTQIYDYTWNHTTQRALKADPAYTYLQDRFELDRVVEQVRERKRHFPEMLEHIEFTRGGGQVIAGGLSLLRFESEARLNDLMAYCEADDILIANPHTYYLDDDSRWYGEAFLRCKQDWDPHNLLNPGHLHALEDAAA